MNTVEVTVYAHQGRWNENNLWYYEDEPGVLEEIRLAKAAGLNVVLILRVQLDHAFDANTFMWHGMIFPETEYLLQRWFEEYGRFVKKWGIIAEREGVDVLVIGSEMNTLFATRICETLPELEEYYLNDLKQQLYKKQMLRFQDQLQEEHLFVYGRPNYASLEAYLDDEMQRKREWAQIVSFADSTDPIHAINVRRTIMNWYWEGLISDLRHNYHGKITIAANFDNYQEVAFWDKLDFIGINAYFPLRNSVNMACQQKNLQQSWEEVFEEILAFREKAGVPHHPILFTELGYGRHEGSTLKPWQGFGFSLIDNRIGKDLIIWKDQPPHTEERNLAVSALYESVQANDFPLAGILYWKLTSKEEQLIYDPFALHIGPASKDSLQSLLVKFKGLEATMNKQED